MPGFVKLELPGLDKQGTLTHETSEEVRAAEGEQ